MEQITLADIAKFVAFVVALWTGIDYLVKKVNTFTKKAVEDALKPINESVNNLAKKIDNVDMNATKNFLVSAFDTVEKQQYIDEVARQRLYEQYEHYQNLGGNSYIKAKFEQLKKDGLI